jgi:hypothetical protein
MTSEVRAGLLSHRTGHLRRMLTLERTRQGDLLR